MNDELTSRGIHVLNRTKVVEVTQDEVLLSTGSRVHHHIVIWCTGAAPHPVHEQFAQAKIAKPYTQEYWANMALV